MALYNSVGEKATLKTVFENSLLNFTKVFFKVQKNENFIANWHHIYLCKLLEGVYNGEYKNLIINMPPGGSKTAIISTMFPIWCFAKSPHCRFLLISYSDELVTSISQSIKDTIVSKEFLDFFPGYSFKQNVDKKNEWQLEHFGKLQGELFATSFGGGVTGRRGGFVTPDFSGAIILDDTNKPSDMGSEAYRKKTNEFLYDVAKSRKGCFNTPIVLVQQRLHPEDNSGYLLEYAKEDNWTQVKIPAIITKEYIDTLPDDIKQYANRVCGKYIEEFGESSYFPQKESLEELRAFKSISPYAFAAQYMQEPVPKGGQLFQPSWFQYYEEDPMKFDTVKIFADTAIGVKQHNDYSVFIVTGEKDNNLYLLDMVRGKYEAPQLNQVTKDFCLKAMTKYSSSPFGGIYIEFKASGQGLIQHLRQETRLPVFDITPKGDKILRANQVIPYIASGRVFVPKNAEWMVDFMKEISEFSPLMTHKHDDQVDCLVYACLNAYVDRREAHVSNLRF